MRTRNPGFILLITVTVAIVFVVACNLYADVTFTVTPSSGTGGAISPNTPKTFDQGATATFTVTPDKGYIGSVGGTCGGNLSDNTYTTNAITSNCTVAASFMHYKYTDNGNGTVMDKTTGLLWQEGENATRYNWYQASGTYDATYNLSSQNVCGSLSLEGGGWRLPTLAELQTLVDKNFNPKLNTIFFPEAYAYYYWSATSYSSNPNDAWGVDFKNGVTSSNGRPYTYYVRCVRS